MMTNIRSIDNLSISSNESSSVVQLKIMAELMKKLRQKVAILEALMVEHLSKDEIVVEDIADYQNLKTYKIPLPVLEYTEYVHPDQILRCESSSNYTFVYLREGRKVILSKTLKWIEELLPAYFLRIHQSHLVNKHYVARYHRRGNHYLVLEDGSKIPVSKKGRTIFKKENRLYSER